MLAEIWTGLRAYGSADSILQMDANAKRGLGSEAGVQVGAVEELLATGVRVAGSGGKFSNQDMGGLLRSATSFLSSKLGALGPFASTIMNLFVQQSGLIGHQVAANSQVAEKTNQSIAAVGEGASQGFDLTKNLADQAVQAVGSKIEAAVAPITGGMQLPITPMLSELAKNVMNKA